MNPDERFEERLRELSKTDPGHDPTAAWKVEILHRATAAATAPRRIAPPRGLVLAWGAAWAVIALLSWSQPEEEDTTPVANTPGTPFTLLFAYRSELLKQLDLP